MHSRGSAWACALALLLSPGEGILAVCSGGPPRERPPRKGPAGYPVGEIAPSRGYPVDQAPPPTRYQVGDYSVWWQVNRDDILMTAKPEADPLEAYARKASPDTLDDLLGLVGYEGDFCSLVREVGMRRLRRRPGVEAELLAVLGGAEGPAARRVWAAAALGELGGRKAVPALIEALGSPVADLRAFAAAALGRLGDPEGVSAALSLAEDPSQGEAVRCMAVLGLAGSPLAEARSGLDGLSRIEAPLSVRRAALMALGVKAGDAEAGYLQGAVEDKDPAVRAAALIGLGFSGRGREAVERRLKMNVERDEGVRCCAALALGMLGDPAAAPALVAALEKDRDYDVKGYSALSLGRCADPRGFEALAKAAADRHSEFVQTYAAIGLGLTGRAEALPPLVEGLESRQFDVVTSSAAGIALLGLPEAAAPLARAVEDRHHEIVREYAVVALGRLRQPGSLPGLLATLEDKAMTVRHAGALALAVYGDPAACPALEKAIGDREEPVRMTASLGFDLLTDDAARPLTLGDRFKASGRSRASRTAGLPEIMGLLNRHAPPQFKLPVAP